MTTEELLKKCILDKYGSINSFCVTNEIPYTTVVNIFNRGMNGASIGVLVRICKALGISLDKLVEGKVEKRIMNINEVSQFDLELLTAFHDHPEYEEVILKILNVEPPTFPLRKNEEDENNPTD